MCSSDLTALSAPDHSVTESTQSTAALRRATHKAIAGVEEDLERLRFNKAVAQIYELANALQAALPTQGAPIAASHHAALQEAVLILVQLIGPMMPHLAESCWVALGQDGTITEAAWPICDRSLLVDVEMTLPIQVNGKRRADITLPRDADDETIRSAVLALDAVKKALEGRVVKKLIIVPQRIINVVG